VEPDPEPLPTVPDPEPLPTEPDPGALPEEPDPAALPEAPDPAALPEARHEAARAPVTIEDWAPEAQAPGGSPHRKRLTWVLAAAAALALVAGAVVAMIATTHHPALAAGNRGHPTTRPASSHSPASKPSATSGSSTSPPAASPVPASPTPAQGTPGPAAIPAGYHGFRNSTGFSIAVPDGWRVSHQGHYVYLLPPSGGDFLLIDQSDHPQPNPLADWQQQEANRESTYPGYHRIRLESVRYAPAEKAADWEFTYYHQGVLTHVLNRNVLANAHHAYALYWSTPESQWGQSWHIFKVLAATFRPAAP
jgi:hypothetical protein